MKSVRRVMVTTRTKQKNNNKLNKITSIIL